VIVVELVGVELVVDVLVLEVEVEVEVDVVVVVGPQLSDSVTLVRSRVASVGYTLARASKRSCWLAPAGTATFWKTVCTPVALSVTVTQPESACAVPAGRSPSAIGITPISDSTYRRTRRGVILLMTDIGGVPQRFFTTAGLIGTLHVDLERCNFEGTFCHRFATGRIQLTLYSRLRSGISQRELGVAGIKSR
jgi:hypothetical protein